ncbi:MAG TPA: aminotransferase class III-fold pyridoxal phosphate-dependent enzyme [Candidatus Binatia bacterium]
MMRRMSHDLSQTFALFERAQRVVPGGIYGHQTPALLVPGAYPYFFARGDGSHVWDVDGNEYIDYLCSYGPIVLGHRHPAVEEAVLRQMRDGNCFNGPTPLWVELAEHLVAITPFADWAVFAKNGSDVCTWAIEVARAATGRRKVVKAAGAYHGAHAWCSPLPGGITEADRAHVLEVPWNDLAALAACVDEAHGDVAAIILSPFRHDSFHDSELPASGYLAGVRRLCDAQGIVFVLDDVRAGFRLHMGGSGEYFGVRPDLACYCKAIANGYPLSACVGRDALRDAARAVFFTGSYFTSGVPMAAALACLRTLAATDGIARMDALGRRLCTGLERAAAAHDLRVVTSGPPALPFMSFRDDSGQSANRVFCGAMAERGVYLHPHHNWFLSAAHTEADIDRTLDHADEAFAVVATGRA